MKATGWSGIVHFPYRINAREELREHETEGGGFRYRVHTPFLLRTQGSPITDEVPSNLWPDFQWHHSVHKRVREEPMAPINMRYNGAKWYDGLRIDISGPATEERISPFVLSFMRWLRHLSHQPWIGDVDRHYPSILKRVFPIDDRGAAVNEVSPFAEIVGASFQCVTDAIWHQAFQLAASGREVPVYVNLYFDGINASATHDYARAVMNLAMALESCRDINFARLWPAEDVEGRGPQLEAPFDDNNLLNHISKDAREAFNRDFSTEYPKHWPHIRNLYIARHHVAHGKRAVFPDDGGLKTVDGESFDKMRLATEQAISWMEALQKRVDSTGTSTPDDSIQREGQKP
jgi:hypothetical protein